MVKFYNPKLIFKWKEACILWGETSKRHPCRSHCLDLKWTGDSLSTELAAEYRGGGRRAFSFPRLFFKKTLFEDLHLLTRFQGYQLQIRVKVMSPF